MKVIKVNCNQSGTRLFNVGGMSMIFEDWEKDCYKKVILSMLDVPDNRVNEQPLTKKCSSQTNKK